MFIFPAFYAQGVAAGCVGPLGAVAFERVPKTDDWEGGGGLVASTIDFTRTVFHADFNSDKISLLNRWGAVKGIDR